MLNRAADGLTPLDIMLNASRAAYATATKDPDKVDAELLKLAEAWAKDAAPYVHPKFLMAQLSPKGGEGAGAPVSGMAMVQYYTPDNGRRVAIPGPANDAAAPAAKKPNGNGTHA